MFSKNRNIKIFLQPFIPHYRTSFFKKLSQHIEIEVVCFEKISKEFCAADFPIKKVEKINFHSFLLYNPFQLLFTKSSTLVLMLHFGHLTTWLLLLTKFIHQKKIILWGQGISVKRYIKEEKKPDWKLRWMISLADGLWTYTEKEAVQWKNIFPKKTIIALNNTQETSLPHQDFDIEDLKKKYQITQKRILIFAARFENPYRRTDLLVETIKKLDPKEYGFIIIGDGNLKPDFSKYSNVYDFGRLYDEEIKKELFAISDIYFQPGWVGLSIVEAMSHALPIFTFVRTEDIKQCVEYVYIEHRKNGMLFENMSQCLETIKNTSTEELKKMGKNGQDLVHSKLTIDNMVTNALKSFQ